LSKRRRKDKSAKKEQNRAMLTDVRSRADKDVAIKYCRQTQLERAWRREQEKKLKTRRGGKGVKKQVKSRMKLRDGVEAR